MPGDFEVSFGGVVVHGFHVYQVVWSPVIGEELSSEGEHGNIKDAFAVAIMKSGTTVGHIPWKISKTCWHFLWRRVEVPCIYTLKGKKKLVDKITILQEMKFKPSS